MRWFGVMVVALALVACGDDGTEGASVGSGTESSGTESSGTVGPSPTIPGTSGDTVNADTSDGGSSGMPPVSECSPDEQLLIDLVNVYRGENGLAPIPASPSLCIVGHAHAEDLQLNAPHELEDCNLHSWSDAGAWSSCCYTPDHMQAQCMWDKPRELTVYFGNGYENAAGGGSGSITPEVALELWKGSAGHNAVILNLDQWSDNTWQAMGAGVFGGYAVLWFGQEPDPAG